MYIIDPKLKGNIRRYFIQCICITIFIYLVISIVDVTMNITLVASIGATTFIVFTMPHRRVSNVRYVLGGYIIGILTGTLCWFFGSTYNFIGLSFAGALAIGISIFFMAITNTEHPPAAAFAFGIVMDGFHLKTIVIMLFILILFQIIKKFTKKWLIDLV
ncbi:MAG: hypothetical protein CVV02_12750 [Firmicutes bacterium HGW-Firmicutes-7]|nr:MAG: hypothetical protein CVV02_12750 [Firmicutes bacterium HGW-Firmicutes-7]